MCILKCIRDCIRRRRRIKGNENPFQDVRLEHKEDSNKEIITVSLDVKGPVDVEALRKTIAELIAIEMIHINCINIQRVEHTEDSTIEYIGSIELLRTQENMKQLTTE